MHKFTKIPTMRSRTAGRFSAKANVMI